ncbi:MAG: sigma-54-dependent Fis family transcriptional regulator [Planctomycetes bacterium]|nr:sigma-54-dependent Fis family transcriptional regulator [Planctomycetota bacterium]
MTMNNKAVILVVDDNKKHADLLCESLKKLSANISVLYDGQEAMDFIEHHHVDLIITELDLHSQTNGLDILTAAKTAGYSTNVIVIASNPTIDSCKQAISRGALDYLEKPLDIENLVEIVAKTFDNADKLYKVDKNFIFAGVVGQSRAIKSVFHILRRVAPTNISVLVEGQSGTGKELVARAIHKNSDRKNKQFIPINCAGLAESLLESELFGHAKGAFTGATVDRKGLFEIADKGTLFLDEIGDMPMPMQAKLLRVLEDGIIVPVGSNKPTVVDIRVISATNCDLAKLVEEKKFRQDLYFRIKGVSITLPPLRSRRQDIPELFGFFLKEVCSELGRSISRITEAAMSILQGYDWPGNIRQLRQCIKIMVVMCEGDTLDVIDIPPEINRIKQIEGQVAPYARQVVGVQMPDISDMSLEELEQMHIRSVLEKTQGNRSEAAKILKIGERTLYRKIKEYNI